MVRASAVVAALVAHTAAVTNGPMPNELLTAIVETDAATAVSNSASTVAPADVLMVSPLPWVMEDELLGSLCLSPNTCTSVGYLPFVTPMGVIALDGDLATTSSGRKMIVFGYSNGAEVAAEWLRQHASDPNAPATDVLSFVVIGNATRAYGGAAAMDGAVWPQSQYQVIDVSRQYDGVSDFPDNAASPYYPLAVANADVGFWTIHLDYSNVDINDPANAVWTVGNTTYVLTPTQTIPLLIPLQALGINVDALNEQLKPLVEQAYTRPAPFPTTDQSASLATSPAAASALSPPAASEPTTAATTGSTTTGPTTNTTDTGPAAADTVTTTATADRADAVAPVKTTTPPAAQARRNTAIEGAQSTTAPITRTSTADRNKVEPSQVGGQHTTSDGGPANTGNSISDQLVSARR